MPTETPLPPLDDAGRLAALHGYDILDTPPEAAFQDLARLAALICGTPIALIGFVDAQRVWLKAAIGLDLHEVCPSGTPCGQVLRQRSVLVIEDLASHPDFGRHPLVTGEMGLRFFAGVPLITGEGWAIGALCVADRVPRQLRQEQREALVSLSGQVITQLDHRRNARRLEQSIANHEATEAALRAAEAKYRDIFENAGEGIFQTTPAGHYLAANPKLAGIYGYPSPEALIAAVRDIRHQIYVDPHRRDEFIRLMNERGEVTNFESQVFRHDGGVIWISENARAVCDAGRTVRYFEGTVEDITDRRRAEEALRHSELLYHSLVECLPQSIFRKDTAGRFTFVNQLFCQTLGRGAAEILGKTDFDLFPAELAAKYQEDDRRVMGSAATLDTIEAHRRGPGDQIFVHVLKTPLRDGDGQVIGVQGIFWDVTERRRIEEALAHERDLLQALLDNVPDAIYFKDAQSRFLACSRALAAKFGLTDPSALAGKTDFDFFAEEHARAAYDDEQRILHTGQPIIGLKEKETLPNGRVTWALTSKLPLRDKAGTIIGTFGISKDITSLVEAEQALAKARDAALESTRLKSEFLANMSHEIRTPMNAIIGMSGLLLQTSLTADQRDFAETVRNSAEALLSILNDILDFSKIEAGRMSLETIDFDLREVLESTVELLAGSAHGKGIELISWMPEDVARYLRGDPGRLRQILTNLVGNAIKFTERGEVLIRVTSAGEEGDHVTLRVEVHDTGIGINAEAQTRIFRAFSQADGSTTRKYGGTGLGLAICEQLVQLMGGQIGVESQPARGSTFWFTATFERQLTPAPAGAAPLDYFLGLRVLVVDDNATNRRILLHQLRNWQMAPSEAASGAEALAPLRGAAQAGSPFALVILDMQMPEMDGLMLAAAIRADSRLTGSHLLMLTSLGDHLEAEVLRARGIDACLVKPVKQSRLLDALATVAGVTGPHQDGQPALIPALPGPTAPVAPGPLRALRVLVAEDNMVNQKLALRQLRNLGQHADAVANGQEVLTALRRIPYDLLLLDCQMPELDGYETARLIRQQEAPLALMPGHNKPPLHIVAMTANAMHGDREKCLTAGMDDYVSKPVRLAELEAALRRAAARLPPEAGLPVSPTLPSGVDPGVLHALRELALPGQPDPVVELAGLFLTDARLLVARMR